MIGMQRIRRRIEAVMRDRDADRSARTTLLAAASVLYGTGTSLRARAFRTGALKARRLPCRVISVGNITAGGTGKTPMTVYLARLLKNKGFSPAVVSRGYGGTASKSGGVVSDGARVFMDAAAAGDEPSMIAGLLRDIPVIVGRDRFRAGTLAVKRFHSDVIILDDGFQHMKLERDVNLVLLDHDRPFGNGRLLPRGPLREPLSALDRADAFVLTRSGPNAIAPELIAAMAGARPAFRSRHLGVFRRLVPPGAGLGEDGETPHPSALNGRAVFAFSGIAGNDGFIQTLKDFDCKVAGASGFPDHHAYDRADLARIISGARRTGADWLATTEKDAARVAGMGPLPLDLAVIGVETSMGDDEGRFLDFLKARLE